jgi:hypothetical protein
MGEYADSLKKTNKRKDASESVTAAREAAAKEAAKAAKARADEAARAKARESAQKAADLKAAQKIPVRDAHDKPKTVTTPLPPVKPPPVKPPPKKIPQSSGPADVVTVTTKEDFVDSTPTMPPTPTPPATTVVEAPVVRVPTRNVTDISSLVPQLNAEEIQRLLFENLSAVELSMVERHDTIEGIDQKYSIISNLSEIRKKYDIRKQLTIMDKFKPLTSIFIINIQDKIPQEDYIALESLNSTYKYLDENNQIVTREKGYYYIDTNGDLVIELINLEKNQQVEIQIDTNGTIYKVEL